MRRSAAGRAWAWRLLLGLIVVLPGAPAVFAAVWDTAITPLSGDNFSRAEFRLWCDETSGPGIAAVRGLLVLVPGWNGDGRGLVNDPGWQQLARELGVAIVAVHWRGDGTETEAPYHIVTAGRGSGAAWLRALARLASDSRHPEVARAPWLVWGHSAGGQFGYGLACAYPERMAAFVAAKGGIYETRFNTQARGVPGLFIIGEKDAEWRAERITALFERERAQGAFWALGWEVGAGHEIGQSSGLARAFLKEAALLRLGQNQVTYSLRAISLNTGWIGDRARYQEVRPVPVKADRLVRTVWLPGPESAQQWIRLGAPDGG